MTRPSYTHKDYVKVAAALAEARAEIRARLLDLQTNGVEGEYAIEAVEVRLSRMFADDNVNFDRARFHAAAIGQPLTGRDRPRLTGAERIREAQR